MSTNAKVNYNSKKRSDRKKVYAELSETDKAIWDEIASLKNQINQSTRAVGAVRNVMKNSEKQLSEQIQTDRQKLPEVARNLADDLPVDYPAQFTVTGKSDYLKSVMMPDSGPAYIPDDVVQQCHVKTETVTYNLNVADSGAGALLIFPDHPTDLIGYHYIQNTLGAYEFDRILRTAQNLSDNYDYARRVSQLLTIKSSTIPSGVYALNGTFNAVRVEGTLSEIPSLQLTGDEFYNGILTNTVDNYDKVGNVLVGDGLAILSLLPNVDQPFMRLSDTAPVSTNGTVQENCIMDLSNSLNYHLAQTISSFGISPSGFQSFETVMNVDSTMGVIIDLELDWNWAVAIPDPYVVQCLFQFLDPFGNTIPTPHGAGIAELAANTAIFFTNSITYHYSFQNFEGPPIAAIRLTIQGFGVTTVTNGSARMKVDAKVPTGARSGVNKPVVVAAYQGVAAGSVLTVSGQTNMELVPNPVLRQNLQLENSYADEKEMEYAKNLLHNRHLVGLKSVWNLKDYWALRPALEELADVHVGTTQPESHAMALSGSDIVRFLKKKVIPFVVPKLVRIGNSLLPQAAPLFNGLGALANNWSSKAASGFPVARASTSRSLAATSKVQFDPKFAKSFKSVAIDRFGAPKGRVVSKKVGKPVRVPKPRAGVIVPARWRGVAFPTLTVLDTNPTKPIGGELFLASNTKPFGFSSPVQTATTCGKTIYGLDRGEPYELQLSSDVWVFPIDPVAYLAGKIRPEASKGAEGHSADAAVFIAANGSFSGVPQVPITGQLDDSGNIKPNEAFDAKLAWCSARGLNLAVQGECKLAGRLHLEHLFEDEEIEIPPPPQQPLAKLVAQIPMAYQLSRQLRVLSFAPWYRVSELMPLLKSFRDKNPSIVAVRAEMVEALAKAPVPAPYAANQRFPDGVDYICESMAEWTLLFQQLRSAINYKPSGNVGKRRAEGGGDGDVEFQAGNDTTLSFWTATTTIIDKLVKLEDVYDRASFEAKFNLNWA